MPKNKGEQLHAELITLAAPRPTPRLGPRSRGPLGAVRGPAGHASRPHARLLLPQPPAPPLLERRQSVLLLPAAGKGGKNRRRGKNDSDDKRELIFKEDGELPPPGACLLPLSVAAAAGSRLLGCLSPVLTITRSASPLPCAAGQGEPTVLPACRGQPRLRGTGPASLPCSRA